jgi:hypothetical protein
MMCLRGTWIKLAKAPMAVADLVLALGCFKFNKQHNSIV